MSVTAKDRPPRFRSALSAALALLLLVPVTLLFLPLWRSAADDITTAQRERRGIEYLTRLGQLLNATSQAQTAALQGAAAPAALAEAIGATAEVDGRLGAEFATQARWSALRGKMDKLPRSAPGQELATYQAYVEVSDLLLGMYRTVRDNAGLARDPDPDTFYLQQAAGNRLPAAAVQASRVADLTTLAPQVKADQRAVVGAGLALAVQKVGEEVTGMTGDLQEAAENTESRTLSGGVLNGMEKFRRGVDGLVLGGSAVLKAASGKPAAGAAPTGGSVAAGLAQLAGLRADMQAGAGDLNATMLREADQLLATRIDDARSRQRTALLTAVLAGLLALAGVLVALSGRDRRAGRAAPSVADTAGARGTGPSATNQEPARGDVLAGTPRLFGDDVATAQWERPDVLR